MISNQAPGQRPFGMVNSEPLAPNGTAASPPEPPILGASPAPAIASGAWHKKSVLLVDSNPRSRESRAKVMRALGVLVDTVPSAVTARTQLTVLKYNLVLVDLGRDLDNAKSLGAEIKARNPRQLIGYLVGSPRYVAASPDGGAGRLHRAPRPVPVAQPVKAPPVKDFGQRVRDAEAEQLA